MQLSTTFGVLLLTTVYLCNYLVSSQQGYCNGIASNCGTRCSANIQCMGGACEIEQTPCGSSSGSNGASSTSSTSNGTGSKNQENRIKDSTDDKSKLTTGYIVFAVIAILVCSLFVFAVFKWSTIPRRNPHEVKDSV